MLDLGKVEAWRLREAIQELQAKITNGSIPRDGAIAQAIAREIASAEKQIAGIERKDEAGRAKEREESLRELAIAYMVERETALNAEEMRQYGEFLKKEFFTKADFCSLEKFYTNSYEKLTDSGKAEMSTRVFEGVRRKEYEFIELPDIVKEKEAQRLRDLLSESTLAPNLKKIPSSDRTDFIGAWDSGKREESYQVLNRATFAENVSLPVKAFKSADVAVTHSADAMKVVESEGARVPSKIDVQKGLGDLTIGPDDVKLLSNEGVPSGAPLSGTKGSAKEKGG
jgi:hypothetical protein